MAWPRCGCSPRSWPPPACRPTTRATCRSSRAPRRRRPRSFDLVVGASSIYGGSWLEGSGAVYAENETLRWIADLAGLPAGAGGAFVPGGTIGNLSALVAARHTARHNALEAGCGRSPGGVATTYGAHSSIQSACDVMDAELVGGATPTTGGG